QRRAIVHAVHFHRAGVVGRPFIDGTIDPGEDRGELGPACRGGEWGELEVEAVSRFDPAIPDRVGRGPAEVGSGAVSLTGRKAGIRFPRTVLPALRPVASGPQCRSKRMTRQ
ncbi:MAG: hypothetical protein ACPGNT_06630, partial [Rhodospirillales bacterium]